MPRYVNGLACGFPKSFKLKYFNGSSWEEVLTENEFPRPNRNDIIIIPFTNIITASALTLESITLGKDDVNNNVFQMAEINAGLNTDFDIKFKHLGSNSPYKNIGSLEIQNVGSKTFNPNKLNVWHYDIRKPFKSDNNIYAPTIVKNSPSKLTSVNECWNIYYGGYANGNNQHDNIYLTTSYDDFLTTSGFATCISNVNYNNANNGSAIKLFDEWKMLYTVEVITGVRNKPFYANSFDGLNWSFNNPITMNGYPDWRKADVNGGNSLIYYNGLYHMFFNDLNPNTQNKVYHATSTDYINYNYVGIAQDKNMVSQDVKKFNYNNSDYFLLGTHLNAHFIELTLSNNLNYFPNSPNIIINRSQHPQDRFITSLGLVEDKNRLYGLLYASSSNIGFLDNKLYATWLQHKVIFENSHVRWGDIEEAFGPDRIEMFTNTPNQIETGRFYVYDSDGTSLIYTSPLVSVKSGDVWKFLN